MRCWGYMVEVVFKYQGNINEILGIYGWSSIEILEKYEWNIEDTWLK